MVNLFPFNLSARMWFVRKFFSKKQKEACQRVLLGVPKDYNVCVKQQGHKGPHMTVDGFEWY